MDVGETSKLGIKIIMQKFLINFQLTRNRNNRFDHKTFLHLMGRSSPRSKSLLCLTEFSTRSKHYAVEEPKQQIWRQWISHTIMTLSLNRQLSALT